MSANGVLAAVNSVIPALRGQLFSEAAQRDPDCARAIVQAYNDWHIDAWCGAAPGRLIPMAVPMFWDVDALVAEARRVAAKGCHAFTFSANPYDLGFPSLHSDYWDPFWAVCQELGIVLCMHLRIQFEVRYHRTGRAIPGRDHASRDPAVHLRG